MPRAGLNALKKIKSLLLSGIKPHVLSCRACSLATMPTEMSWLKSAGNRNQNSNRINKKLTPLESVLLHLVLFLHLVQMAQVMLQEKESPHFSSLLLVTPWEQSVCLLLHLSHLVGSKARESVKYSVDSEIHVTFLKYRQHAWSSGTGFSPSTLVFMSVPFYQYSVPTFCSSTHDATLSWQLTTSLNTLLSQWACSSVCTASSINNRIVWAKKFPHRI